MNDRFWTFALAGPLCLLAAPLSALAQGSPSPGGGAIDLATGELPSFLELYYTSPIINGVIAGLSVIAVAVFLFLLLTINDRAMVPPDLVDEVNKLVGRGKYEAAADLCRAHRRVFVATVLQRAIENADRGHSVLLDMIDSEGRRRADVIWNRISYLADISNVAPMLGLLGTVTGMIRAFYVVRGQEMSATTDVLTDAIAQAMSTTMFGLGVAIMALFFYTVIKGRATRVLADAEMAVHSIADHIKRSDAPRTPAVATPAEPDDRGAAAAVIGTRYERRRETDR